MIPIMAVTTVAALDEVPDDLRLCARTLGASSRYTMLRVQIRAALPGILTGMRISMAGAWTSIVAAELIAATTGLGYLIMQAGDYLNTALVFSASSPSRSWASPWTPACAPCSSWPTPAGDGESRAAARVSARPNGRQESARPGEENSACYQCCVCMRSRQEFSVT